MRIFVRAAIVGSFAAVAEETGLSGPMVGKHVKALEQAAGARLINRTTRRQSLTEIGLSYFARCKDILAEIDALDRFAAESAGIRGKLRISMPVHFGRHCASPILLRLLLAHPELELELSFSDQLLDLATGRFDLAVRTGTLEDRSDHMARRIARQRMVVCAAPRYLAENGAPESLADLGHHAALLYGRDGRIAPWMFPSSEGPAREVSVKPRAVLDDLDAIADAAADGLGIAWLPLWLVRRRIAAGALEQILEDEGEYPYDCHAVWLATPFMQTKVRLAIDALASQLPRLMD
ncbi:DNA-binding transcriptional LysR family regulator [Sphingomonas naasensis]|nr:LysR family transcriptional regulator [Sphingomonas naasensis]NIJ21124.1 DNA-binding transcriptional LysR family regulator [Sphingomonas naasensis]